MQATAKILVVDDEASIRTMIAAMLTDEGFLVSSASNGLEALREVATGPPDLIVLDMQMPVMDGPTFFRELRSTGVLTPVILVSAADAKRAQRELQAEAALAKPFDLRDLLKRVAALLSQQSPQTPTAS